MKKIVLAITLAGAFVLGYAVAGPAVHDMMLKGRGISEISKLLGTSVRDLHGEDLGIITKLVAGPGRHLGFAVLSYWISDDTQRRVAVPFSALSCKERNCILNANKETFISAPTFVFEDDLSAPRLAEHIYRHFGIQPYWAGKETKK